MKYHAILKVKKQALDRAEADLARAKQRQKENLEKLELAKKDYANLSLPSGGNSSLLKQSLEFKAVAEATQKQAREKVELSQKEVAHYEFIYKKFLLDYEKIKYLETQELKKVQKELLKAEEKFIDEIAVSRFFSQQKGQE